MILKRNTSNSFYVNPQKVMRTKKKAENQRVGIFLLSLKPNIFSKGQQQKRNLVEIILHNLEEIEWFGCSKRHQKTRDEIEDEIKQKIEEIKQRRLQKERVNS